MHPMPADTAPLPQFVYRCHGLTVRSCLPLPFVQLPGTEECPSDIQITFAPPSPDGDDETAVRERISYADGLAFDILNGTRIRVTAPKGSDPPSLGVLVTTGPWKALLLQRGLIPFRGSVIARGEQATVITGRRGRGASTLALALMNAGGRLISDGIFTLAPTGHGGICVPTGQIRLDVWEDTARPGARNRAMQRLHPDLPRYGITETAPVPGPHAVKQLLFISRGHGKTTSARPMAAPEALERLVALTDQHLLVRSPASRPRLLSLLADMVTSAPAHEVFAGSDLLAAETPSVLEHPGWPEREA